MKTSAIIVAAGTGSRMQSDIPKQFLTLGDRTVLYHTISKFLKAKQVFEIVVVVARKYLKSDYLKSSIPQDATKPIKVVAGGKTRQKSVENGLKATDSKANYVLTHDGVRPLISSKLIDSAISACENHDGIIVGVPAVDTLKKVDGTKIIQKIDRRVVWQLHTPQIFPMEVLKHSVEIAKMNGMAFTDESSLVKPMFEDVHVFQGEKTNIKITVIEDLVIAKAIMDNYEN